MSTEFTNKQLALFAMRPCIAGTNPAKQEEALSRLQGRGIDFKNQYPQGWVPNGERLKSLSHLNQI